MAKEIDTSWMTEAELERHERGPKVRANQVLRVRGSHKFTRPLNLPMARCICGESVRAPRELAFLEQRDYVLDWFTGHLKALA